MLSGRNKDLIATVVGGYVVYRVANWLFPFVFMLFVIGMFLNIGQCTYNKITGEPSVVEPHVDRAARRTRPQPTLNADGNTSSLPTLESQYGEVTKPDETEEYDLIGKIEKALRKRDLHQVRRLLKKFTTVTGNEAEAASMVADQGYIATAIVRLGRVVRNLNRLQAVLAKSEREFRGKNAFVRKLDEATTILKKLVKEMNEARHAG